MARSTLTTEAVLSSSVLLDGSGSVVGDDTWAVLTMSPTWPGSMATTMSTVAVAPSANRPASVQVTSCPAAEQVQPGDTEVKLT